MAGLTAEFAENDQDNVTFRKLGANFHEHPILDVLDNRISIKRVDSEGKELYFGVLERNKQPVTLNKYELLALLRTLKRYSKSQSPEGIVADWRNPQHKEKHRALGKNGEWDSLIEHDLKPLIDVVSHFPRESGLINTVENIWEQNLTELRFGLVYSEYSSHSAKQRLCKAFNRFVKNEGRGFLQELITNYDDNNNNSVRRRLVNQKLEDQLIMLDSLKMNNPFVVSAHDTMIAEFLKHFGTTPVERFWKLFTLECGFPNPTFPSSKTANENFLELDKKGKGVKVDDVFINIADPNDGEQNATSRVLYPAFFPDFGRELLSLTPVFAWEKNSKGIRRCLNESQVDRFLCRNFPELATDVYMSSFAGFLCLVYAQEEIRRHFPEKAAFHNGGDEQEMQEGQVIYLAKLGEKRFMNTDFVSSLEGTAKIV